MLRPSFLTLIVALSATALARNCGLKIAPCPADKVCQPKSPKCTDLNRCLGTCVRPTYPVPATTYASCGGFRVNPAPSCPTGYVCRDDPRQKGCGMACDMPGICIPNNAPTCSGITGKPCPEGLDCYDFPGDGCSPDNGGADCIGICLFPPN